MDRLLFGDNQFFGVNHMSEEKARAQAMRFQDIDAVQAVLDAAYDEGVTTFMCTTHDRIAAVADHVRANPERYPQMTFFPCMPYAHKYANAMTEDGPLGALRRFLPDEGFLDAAMRGAQIPGQEGHRGHHHAAGRRRDEDVRRASSTPVIFLQNVVVDLLLGMGFDEAFRIFADHVAGPLRRRARLHHDEHAAAARCPRPARHREPDRLLQHQQGRLPHVRGHRGLPARSSPSEQFRAIAMSVFASGAIPPKEAIEWVCAQPNIDSIVFGASSRTNIRATRELVDEFWGRNHDQEGDGREG